MKRYFSLALVIAALVATSTTPAAAASWLFGRSYYSHTPVRPVHAGRQRAVGPLFTRPQGAYVNSGYRYMNSQIRVGGQTYDHLNVYESWIQTGEQF